MRRVIAVACLLLAGCADHANEDAQAQAQAQTFKIEGVECRNERGWFKGEVTIRNEGPGEARFAKVYIASGSRRVDATFIPMTIPQGSYASAKWMKQGESGADCTISAIQGRDGRQIKIES